MAAFKEHVNVTAIAVGIVVVALYDGDVLTLYQALTAFFIGLVGGLLPDIDSDNSKPLQVVFKIISIVLPLLILLAFFPAMPVLKTVLLWIVFALLLRLTLFKLFLHLTHHRGIFHSVPMALLVAELTILFSYKVIKLDLQLAAVYGFVIFFGFLTHLILDEVYSINALGIKMKKSFGTALKLYDKHNMIGTAILYVLVIGIYILFLPHLDDEIVKLFHTVYDSLHFV